MFLLPNILERPLKATGRFLLNKNFRNKILKQTKLFKTNYYPALMHKCFQYQNVDIQIFRSRKGAHDFVQKILK